MNRARVLWAYFRISVMGEAAYRLNFFIQLFQSVISLGISIAGLAIVFSYTSSLGGWKPDEVLALVGVYYLFLGMIGLVIRPALGAFIESVRDGMLDYLLTKPEDAQVLASIQRAEIWSLIDMALGVSVLVVSLVRLGSGVGIAEAALFVLMVLSGTVIIYSFLLILASLSFWFVRVENILVVFQSMFESGGTWPVSLYPGWLRYGLTFIIPVAFASTIPAEALTGRLGWGTLLTGLVLAATLFVVARLVWKAGLRRYSGASS